MSKLTKFFKNPIIFFRDAYAKRKVGNTAPNIGIYNQLIRFIHNTPVNSLKYENEFVWPFIRHHFLVQLTAVSVGKNNFKKAKKDLLQLGNPSDLTYKTKLEWLARYDIKFLSQISPVADLDFLFISNINASGHVEIDNSIYHRVVDPIYEKALHVGKAMKLELVRNNSDGITKVSRYFHKPLMVFSSEIVRYGYHQKVNIPSEFIRNLRRYLTSLEIGHGDIENIIDWELNARDFYIELLEKLNPKIVLFDAFHYCAPLISAARFLNIRTIDIQHGIQVGYNPLYNYWDEMPLDGYDSLPDYFFVWGEYEAQNIQKVFRSKRHTPIIVGNQWLERQSNFPSNLSSELRSKAGQYKHVVLLAMQSQTAIPSLFKEIIDESGDDILWLIRHHPKGVRYKVKDFSEKNKNIIISKEVDSALLFQLFSVCDVSLSDGSTVAIEGKMFGVSAFITSETGRSNYSEKISKGDFVYIESTEDFFISIKNIGKKNELISTEFGEVNLEQVLGNLLSYKLKEAT